MQTQEAIENRRSIRQFEAKEIPKAKITAILNSGRLAPSAKNRQPWFFVVIKGKVKDEIADIMIKYGQYQNKKEEEILKYPSSVSSSGSIIKQAPILILIFKEKNDQWTIGDNLSIGACVENMCLRAMDFGLGSLWIRDVACVKEEIYSKLGHNEKELNCALVLGYTKSFPKARPRKKLEEISEWIGFETE